MAVYTLLHFPTVGIQRRATDYAIVCLDNHADREIFANVMASLEASDDAKKKQSIIDYYKSHSGKIRVYMIEFKIFKKIMQVPNSKLKLERLTEDLFGQCLPAGGVNSLSIPGYHNCRINYQPPYYVPGHVTSSLR